MNYKGFHQLQWEDRLVIEKMLKVGDSKAKICLLYTSRCV